MPKIKLETRKIQRRIARILLLTYLTSLQPTIPPRSLNLSLTPPLPLPLPPPLPLLHLHQRILHTDRMFFDNALRSPHSPLRLYPLVLRPYMQVERRSAGVVLPTPAVRFIPPDDLSFCSLRQFLDLSLSRRYVYLGTLVLNLLKLYLR